MGSIEHSTTVTKHYGPTVEMQLGEIAKQLRISNSLRALELRLMLDSAKLSNAEELSKEILKILDN